MQNNLGNPQVFLIVKNCKICHCEPLAFSRERSVAGGNPVVYEIATPASARAGLRTPRNDTQNIF